MVINLFNVAATIVAGSIKNQKLREPVRPGKPLLFPIIPLYSSLDKPFVLYIIAFQLFKSGTTVAVPVIPRLAKTEGFLACSLCWGCVALVFSQCYKAQPGKHYRFVSHFFPFCIRMKVERVYRHK